MKRAFFLLFNLLFIGYNFAYAIELHSLQPYEIYPGSEVTIKGAGFTKNMVVTLGTRS